MLRLKRIVAIVLLLLVIGMGTPQVFAGDGPSETPGMTNPGPSETPGLNGPSETPGYNGPSETPGIVDDIITLISSLIP